MDYNDREKITQHMGYLGYKPNSEGTLGVIDLFDSIVNDKAGSNPQLSEFSLHRSLDNIGENII